MANERIMTVRGPVEPAELRATLPHEHVVHSFGESPVVEAHYDIERVAAVAVPGLARLLDYGCNALVECTTEYFGRSVETLRLLSQRSGVHILANTGYYGAANDRYVPEKAYNETAEGLADRWTVEWRDGIGDTGIRPGFIKTAVDHPGPLSEIDAKLVQAAAITHRRTGLVIAVHSPVDAALGTEELAILESEGVSPEAFIWVHADTVQDDEAVVKAARRGAWVEFDSIRAGNLEDRTRLVLRMKQENLLEHVMLSHDETTYLAQRPEADPPPHTTLFTQLIPRLLQSGLEQHDIDLMTVENPRRAFAVRTRTRHNP